MTPETVATRSTLPIPVPAARWGLLLAAVGYFALATAGIWLGRQPGTGAMLWMGNAFGLGLLLHRPRQEAPALLASMLAADVVANLLAHHTAGVALLLAGANLLEIGGMAMLLRLMSSSGTLARTGPLATFALKLGVAATLGPAISGVPGAAVLATAYGTQFPRVWWAWWNAGAIGMVMLLPLMVSISRERVQAALRRPMLLRLIALFVLCMAIGTGAILAGHEPFVVMSLPLVIVALASNPFATALLTLVSALALESIAHLGGMQFLVSRTTPLSGALILVFPICIAFMTEQNRSGRAELRSSERRFRQALEHSAIGMALVGLDGKWQLVNRAMVDLLGYSAEELRDLPFQVMTHPEDLAADLSQLDRLLAGEIDAYRLEKRYRHKQGHYLWALLAVSLVRDEHSGEPRHFIAQIEDIHTRKLAQEQLEAQTRRTQLAVEAGGVGIWEWDFNTAAITWDARMYALHGTDMELGPPSLAE